MRRTNDVPSGNEPGRAGVEWRVLEELRRLRLALRQAERVARWSMALGSRGKGAWARPQLGGAGDGAYPHRIYERTVRVARLDADADARLEAGKRTNLALAAPFFDGLALGPDAPLSFWRALGRTTERRGFVQGMELRAGCIVPAVGGGLCLLSNALFEMALTLGWVVLERHGHSLEAIPLPEDAMWGIDATIYWPHVDLRIAPREGDVRLGVRVAHGALRLTVHARTTRAFTCKLHALDDRTYVRSNGVFRENRIVREVFRHGSSEPVERKVVAVNRKRLLRGHERRGCNACGVLACEKRP